MRLAPAASRLKSQYGKMDQHPLLPLLWSAEVPQLQTAGPSSTEPSRTHEDAAVSASSSETQASDVAVPLETIKKQLVLEEISRSGEMGGSTYE